MKYFVGDVENDDSGHLSDQVAIGVFHKVMKGQLLFLRTGCGRVGGGCIGGGHVVVDYCEYGIE